MNSPAAAGGPASFQTAGSAQQRLRHWRLRCGLLSLLIVTTLVVLFCSLARAEEPDRTAAVRKGARLPEIKQPVLFNTPEADRILATLQIFPPDSPWHEDISRRPLAPNSGRIIAGMEPNRHLYFNSDMGFIMVPRDQRRVPVKIVDYPDESDPGPYPLPDNTPIEGWPLSGGALERLQRAGDGDRHMIVVDAGRARLYEFYIGRRTQRGWQAAQASVFDLASNKTRTPGWTSADAAGLPIFPAVVRYDECQRGVVDHAMRFTARRTRRDYVYPATHFASRSNDPNLPRMGERFRLRQDFDIAGFSPHARAVLVGLKKYGMILADNGINWAISVAPDARLTGLDELSRVKGRDFEVIVPSGEHDGPRRR